VQHPVGWKRALLPRS